MESDFEIKGDRGQFTVQYLLQRSVGDSGRRMRWFGWSVDQSWHFRQDEHSYSRRRGTTTPADGGMTFVLNGTNEI